LTPIQSSSLHSGWAELGLRLISRGAPVAGKCGTRNRKEKSENRSKKRAKGRFSIAAAQPGIAEGSKSVRTGLRMEKERLQKIFEAGSGSFSPN